LPRRRNKKIAMVLAAVFIAVLFMELLAIFSPAISGMVRGGGSVEVVALAPPGGVDEETLKQVAEAIGAKGYRVESLQGVPLTNATRMFYALVVYENGQPVVVTFVPETANATLVARVLETLLQHTAMLRSNETILYLGGRQILRIPRNETGIITLIGNIYQQLAQHPPIPAHAAGNATASTQGSTQG
jgi:hypothetical protein